MPLDQAYFLWLCRQVGQTEDMRNRATTYWKLLKFLHEKPFDWTIDRDANRAQDGKDLRHDFVRETRPRVNKNSDWFQMECSVLEMLVALAWKLAFDGGGEQAEWFWNLVQNLKLSDCTDANSPDKNAVDIILDRMIDRTYNPDGTGGLFPIHHTDEDQRDVEIWYQAQAYLLERIS